MPFMYILECADTTFYTGSTWNLRKRMNEHYAGIGAVYTSRRMPVKLLYFEEYERMDEAYGREKTIHGWSHARKRYLISTGRGVRVTDDMSF
ncbi:GIY-YIG nuclease family protein [Leifsonia flava]|uniref:GIY-YIG nuclease family protein n=1 Tax=Orlajensenia leifsoniae TaxID=2561933 RepID=A0A4Y9R5W2_9MICO|nr:GIY-YIG nuclease family protein [Leifsonia flava]TFV99687.1 GIY-YIG nuclease family protein [Leifsonia flava]